MNVDLTVITPGRTPEIPDESWSFDRLAEFCGLVCRRQAEDAWLIGKAFAVVKARLEHGKWLSWVKEHCPGLSRKTANRYMLLAERCTLDEVRGQGLTECYRRAGMVTAPSGGVVSGPPAAAAAGVPPAGERVREKPTGSGPSDIPSWAVKDPFTVHSGVEGPPVDDAESTHANATRTDITAEAVSSPAHKEAGAEDHPAPGAAGEQDVFGLENDGRDDLPETQVFREELEDRLPNLLASLDNTLGWLLDRWDTAGSQVEAGALADRVASVRDKLAGLADRLVQPLVPRPDGTGTELIESGRTLAV